MTREQVRLIAIQFYGSDSTILDDSMIPANWPHNEVNHEGHPSYNFAVRHHVTISNGGWRTKEIDGMCHFCPAPSFKIVDGKWMHVDSNPLEYICGAD